MAFIESHKQSMEAEFLDVIRAAFVDKEPSYTLISVGTFQPQKKFTEPEKIYCRCAYRAL